MEDKKVFAEAPVGIGRWGDVVDDDGEEYGHLPLPPLSVVGPDENGVTKTTEYRFDDDGNKIKVVTTTRHNKLAPTRLPKVAVVERRTWSKFGHAASDDAASARLTYISNEEILLERPRAPAEMQLVNSEVRQCQVQLGMFRRRGTPPPYTPGHGGKVAVRVVNWSLDADEIDLEDLFRIFGPIRAVSIARNSRSGASKGMAVVNFLYHADAEAAVAAMDGYYVLRPSGATGRLGLGHWYMMLYVVAFVVRRTWPA
ncbi:hypothetical protein ACQ4PT_001143 [Festuca glaucescens]